MRQLGIRPLRAVLIAVAVAGTTLVYVSPTDSLDAVGILAVSAALAAAAEAGIAASRVPVARATALATALLIAIAGLAWAYLA